jgi:CBS domain-containing protein
MCKTMRVRDLLEQKNSKVITVEPGTDLGTAAKLLMEHGVGGLPVVTHDNTPVGFLAEREVVRAVHEYDGPIRHIRVEGLMRPAPMCSADDPVQDAMRRMTRLRLRHLLVQDGGSLVGVISVGDIVKHRLQELETETGVLRDYVAAHRATH